MQFHMRTGSCASAQVPECASITKSVRSAQVHAQLSKCAITQVHKCASTQVLVINLTCYEPAPL